MGIDGIGKGGPPPAVTPAGEDGRAPAPEATRAFEVSGTRARAPEPGDAAPAESSAAAAHVQGPASSALGALRSGTVDLNGYLDRKVDEATAHLGQMPAADLARVRAALRERLATDPTLVDLAHRKTIDAPPRAPRDAPRCSRSGGGARLLAR